MKGLNFELSSPKNINYVNLFAVYILAGGQTRLKFQWMSRSIMALVNVWDFGPLGTAITPLQRGGFPQRKCVLKDICTEIIFMKRFRLSYRKVIFKISYKPFLKTIAFHAGVFRGGWKTSPPKNAGVGGYLNHHPHTLWDLTQWRIQGRGPGGPAPPYF